MQSVLTGVFAVAGTIVGAIASYLLQRRNAEHVEHAAQEQRLWQERLYAYSAFAEAIMELRRGQYDRWHRQHENPQSPAYMDARAESYRLKTIARQAAFRLRMLSNEKQLVERANEILKITEYLHDAADTTELQDRAAQAQRIIDEFIDIASAQVQRIP